MRIKRLELTGFKSFVDHTVLEFPAGITGIVGPNGVGKSNLVDAVRWVLGEQSPRHLRGEAMEDVIFAGNERLGPLGMAEVSLLLERDDDESDMAAGGEGAAEDGLPQQLAGVSEVLVTRRYFRSGESEFAINRVPCRLKDITELFLGTGVGAKAYAIVDQGRVEQMVNARPEELRLFIEEAAGTTRFRSRKVAAERKMARTRENLVRVVDVLREIERQVRTLERQARRAEEHRRWREELRALELAIAATRARRWRGEVGNLEERLARLRARERELEEGLRRAEQAEARWRGDLGEREAAAAARQAELVELRLAIARGEATERARAERAAEIEREIAENEQEREEIETRSRQVEAELDGARQEMHALVGDRPAAEAEIRRRAATAEAARASAEASEREIEAAKDELHALLAEGARLGNARSALVQRREALRGRRERLSAEQCQRGERLAVLAGAAAAARARQEEVEAEGARAAAGRAEAEKEEQRARAAVREREAAAAAIRERVVLTRSRLASLGELVERREGCEKGTAELAARGTGRLLLELLGVPAELEAAVAAALGARLHHLVVRDSEAALAAVEWLTEENRGRAALVLEEHPGGDAFPAAEGEHLLDRLEVNPAARPLAERLLGSVLLAPGLAAACALWRARGGACTVVTPGGAAIDSLGTVSGGSGQPAEEALLARRRELRLLGETLAAEQRDLAAADEALATAHAACAAAETRRRELEERASALAVARVAAEKDASRLEHERAEMEAAVEACAVEVASTDGETAEIEHRLAALEGELTALAERRAAAERHLDAQQRTLAEARARACAEGEKLRALEVEKAARTERERHLRGMVARLEAAVGDLAARAAAARRRAGTLAAERQDRARAEGEAGERLSAQRARLAALSAEVERLVCQAADLRDRLREQRAAAEGARGGLDALRADRGKLEVALAERQLSLQHLDASMREKYEIELEALAAEPSEEVVGEAAAAARIDSLRARLAHMEGVNLAALDELEELRSRQQFLQAQKEDIERSLGDLRRTISRLIRTSEARFAETFAATNERLAEVFPQLFPGGRAWLKLCEGEGDGEPGVEIVVQPAGKKVQSLGLLSGGEKALSAVALILSLFLIRPTPFCLLDEVDAALDEANIGRFNQVTRSMARRSQVVLITHNKRTMEVADTLYGVTMEEAGISKVVAVRLRAAA